MFSSYFGFKVAFLCLLWYTTSSVNNVVGKLVLQAFPYPTTVTLVQFASITVYLLPVLKFIPGARLPYMSWGYYFKMIFPLAFGKFFASLFSHISIGAVPVSYTHTVKASMPLFVVLLTRIINKEKHTTKVYLSLLFIISGVMIASVTELEFNMLGLCAALISIFVFSLQNIYSKMVLKETTIHHLSLLYILAKHSLFMFIPFWIYNDFFDIVFNYHKTDLSGWVISGLLFVNGLCNFLQNVIAFTMLSLVTPLTYSIFNTSKRIVVIGISIVMLRNPVTYSNIFGMSLAIFGVFYYNLAKIEAKKQPLLPTKVLEKQPLTKSHDTATNLLLRHIDHDHKNFLSNSMAKPTYNYNGYMAENRRHISSNGNTKHQSHMYV